MSVKLDNCVACGSPDLRPFWRVLRRCARCGHCVADVDAGSLDFSRIYDDGYFTGEEYDDYLRDRPVFRRQFEDRLREVGAFRRDGDLIEIGCAYGFFLDVARSRFRVRGFDICAGPTRYAREQLGLDVLCQDFATAPAAPQTADVVTMWDTVEHLPRPDLTIQAAANSLRPNGYLFLTTGDIGSPLARLRRSKWRMIHPPTHLHYFSRGSIQRLLRSKGLTPVLTRHVGTRRSVAQVAFRLWQAGREKPSRLYQKIARSRLGQLSFVLNTWDIMLVVARKQEAPASTTAEGSTDRQ
jgi:SAM-dependent methyltransferase